MLSYILLSFNTGFLVFNVEDGRVKALHSAPSIYTNAEDAANQSFYYD